MNRRFVLDLAASGLAMPIAADLVLHEEPDPEAILLDSTRLGGILVATARRYRTPLAVPHMDLELEKYDLLTRLGIPAGEIPKFHFSTPPGPAAHEKLAASLKAPFQPKLEAHFASIAVVARCRDLVPMGMAIGPFSLMTKMISDPISAIVAAGAGMEADEEPGIALVEDLLELGTAMILASLERQIKAGAKAVFIADPAANQVFLSPRQIAAGSNIFERFVMKYNRRVRDFLADHGVALMFHCCGELTNEMLRCFTQLEPVILSLGSSRKLWEDAAIVPKNITLFGNLPSKRFYSDGLITAEQVSVQGRDLRAKLRDLRHPHILGSECDVLSVPGSEASIRGKVKALCACGGPL